MKTHTETEIANFKKLVDHFDLEDQEVRWQQLKNWRRLKLIWEGFQRTYFSEVAHDWRIYDSNLTTGNNDSAYYDKPVNVFKAYLESIIAALSITVPPIKCYPDDADNSLDIATARGSDKIAKLIYQHNDVALLWLHALFIYCTEGLVACHTYVKESEEYGTYKEDTTEEVEVTQKQCPTCGTELDESLFKPSIEDEFNPTDNVSPISCPLCEDIIPPDLQPTTFFVTRIIDTKTLPKSRVCLEAYGGMFVKVPVYAMDQKDIPYLGFSYETNYTSAIHRYPKLREKLRNSAGGLNTSNSSGSTNDEKVMRQNPLYRGDTPTNTVSVRNYWFRPEAYNILSETEYDSLKKEYPDGIKVVFINDLFAECCAEALDDKWTLTKNPLADYLHHNPLGAELVNIQEITNDLISLVLQTIEHGIPQTFADPTVLNFKVYEQSEVMAGGVYPATAKTGKSVSDAFHEVKTATLSQEVLPFFREIQSLGQLASGALPSLFGGQMEGSKTASEYSMSRAQALQRLQNTWKMLTVWWKKVFAKAIPLYISEMREDEKFVEKNRSGGFINVFIHKAELEGKIGRIELEANENLPITWQQQKDVVMELLQSSNPMVMEALASPDNLHYLRDAIGLTDLVISGEDDRDKQREEIKLLSESSPIAVPIDPSIMAQAVMTGQQPPEMEMPSVEIDPLVDNHNVHADVCRNYLVSEEGRQLKSLNPQGYKNILLHFKMHMDELALMMQSQQQVNPESQPNATGNDNVAKPKGNATPLAENNNAPEVVS